MVRLTKTKAKSKTRKHSKKVMTVPQLRRAFEYIDKVSKTQSVDGFRKEWKKTFGKEISRSAAQEYLTMKAKMRGGALSPAPLDYDLRAGADLPYGSFNKYVSNGFGFANESPSVNDNAPVVLPAGMGSNKVGGKRKTRKHSGGGFFDSLSAALSRPINTSITSIPDTPANVLMMSAKGYPTGTGGVYDSPRPEIPAFHYPSAGPSFAAYISPSSRLV